jgi:hypothetical protein
MASNSSVEKLLEELDRIIVKIRNLIDDGCPGIENLGENKHLNSLKILLKDLKKYRHDIQQAYDIDNANIERKMKEKQDKDISNKTR